MYKVPTGGVFTKFMLLKREDLRSRLIRLIGQGRISATTRALDDAGARVTRDLLMQLVVNVTCGELPTQRIVVGLRGATENITDAARRVRDSGANEVVTTLADAGAI